MRTPDPVITLEKIETYGRVRSQLSSFHEEIGALSKKKPDGPVSKFKLQFINQVIKQATELLGDEYRPFPDFNSFEVDMLPSASDVTMMLAQYMEALDSFRGAHTYQTEEYGPLKWRLNAEETDGEDDDSQDDDEPDADNGEENDIDDEDDEADDE